MTSVLELRNVVKRYGDVVALDGVSFALATGELLAVVGESGCGKSTLLRCVNRLVKWDSGAVEVDGQDVRGVDPVSLRRRIGYVPQEDGLLPHWTVGRNVALVPVLRGESCTAERVSELLTMIGLEPSLGARYPRELSGGQRQRVAIARALAASPSLMLLDEPFGALDAITRYELQQLFARLRRERPIAALMVTHDMREAAMLGDRIAVMRRGKIEQIGPAGDVLQTPRAGYVERLVRAAEGALA